MNKHHFKMRIFLTSRILFPFIILTGMLNGQHFVEGTITYKSQELIYIDLGTDDGLAINDTVEIWDDQEQQGMAVVRQAASQTASCFGINRAEFESWKIKDKVRFYPDKSSDVVAAMDSVLLPPDSSVIVSPDTLGRYKNVVTPGKNRNVVEVRPRETRWFGKISTRYLGVAVSNNQSANFNQPSLYLNLNVNNIAGSSFHSNVLVRGRSRSTQDATEHQTRLYSAGVTWQQDNSPLWGSFGRIYHPMLGGVGTVDGIGASYRWHAMQVGAILGFVPVYDSLKIDTESFKWGFSGSFTPTSRDYRATAALITENKNGGTDRQYLYLSSDFSKWRWLRLNGSAELDLDLSGETTTRGTANLTAIYLSGRITPVRGIHIVTRYTQRQNIKLLITQSDTPDSLFDKAFRQGFYGTVMFRPPGPISFGLNGNITNDGEGNRMYIAGVNFRYNQLPGLNGPMNLNLQYFDNLFVRALRAQPRADWNVNADLTLSLGYNLYGYMYKTQLDAHLRQTPQVDIYWRFMKNFYLSGSYSAEMEAGETISQFMIDGAYRFR
ncbi:MAG: hypothetical protein K9N36_03770 [Candidatus Marinimicrobia bacterium]|nr:hypothetical protein [Candidatus Neomarinimicrobiota bacterium]